MSGTDAALKGRVTLEHRLPNAKILSMIVCDHVSDDPEFGLSIMGVSTRFVPPRLPFKKTVEVYFELRLLRGIHSGKVDIVDDHGREAGFATWDTNAKGDVLLFPWRALVPTLFLAPGPHVVRLHTESEVLERELWVDPPPEKPES